MISTTTMFSTNVVFYVVGENNVLNHNIELHYDVNSVSWLACNEREYVIILKISPSVVFYL